MKVINIHSFKNFVYLIREFYFSNTYTYNNKIKKNILKISKLKYKNSSGTFKKYKNTHKHISSVKFKKKITSKNTRDFKIIFTNTLFDDVKVNICNNKIKNDKLLIYLHGYKTSSKDVLNNKNHREYLIDFAKKNLCTLCVWDWPLHGERLNKSLFNNINSVYAAEKEYTKILNLLGSSLFLEYLNEYEVVLKKVISIFKQKKIIIIGYSMGGFFSYFSPFLSGKIEKIFSISSFNDYSNLIRSEKIKVNGLYYYPHNILGYFNFKDIIAEICKSDLKKINIIFGDQDINCSSNFAKKIKKNNKLNIHIIKKNGHLLTKNFLNIVSDEI